MRLVGCLRTHTHNPVGVVISELAPPRLLDAAGRMSASFAERDKLLMALRKAARSALKEVRKKENE